MFINHLNNVVAHHVVFIDTTSVKIIICSKIIKFRLIAQLLSDDSYYIAIKLKKKKIILQTPANGFFMLI